MKLHTFTSHFLIFWNSKSLENIKSKKSNNLVLLRGFLLQWFDLWSIVRRSEVCRSVLSTDTTDRDGAEFWDTILPADTAACRQCSTAHHGPQIILDIYQDNIFIMIPFIKPAKMFLFVNFKFSLIFLRFNTFILRSDWCFKEHFRWLSRV